MTTPTLPEAARMALGALERAERALGHPDNIEYVERAANALRAALAASEAPTTLTDYELTLMAQRASTKGGGLHPWWMVLCREVERRIRQENALDKLAAESQRLGLYDASEAQAEPVGFTSRLALDLLQQGTEAVVFPRSFEHHEVALYTHPPAPQQPAPVDPMDWPLPCDVTVGHGTIAKGCKLRTLVARTTLLYETLQAHYDAPAEHGEQTAQGLTDEQLEALFLKSGGRWDGDRWVIEDADLHPFVRAALASARRVPLTDEQIDKLPWGPHEGNPLTFAEGLRDFARAIERAHGIAAAPQPEGGA